MKMRVLLLGGLLALSLPVAAPLAAGPFLTGWERRVGQQVELSPCYLNTAKVGYLYCDAKNQGTRLYIDTDTFDPDAMQQALENCEGYGKEPQCEVTLSGKLTASFGSPLLVDGRATFLASDRGVQDQDSARGGTLKPGEYACVGSGGSVLAGQGFIVNADGSYTDLDKTTSGSFTVSGANVLFEGGHLGGETGRNLAVDGSFVLGKMVSCSPW